MKNVFIIAEAGVNHNGSLTLAKEMVQAAAEAGADAVKFQTFKASNLVVRNAPKARYQRHTDQKNESQFAMLKKLELVEDDFREIQECCRQNDVIFLSTPFDLQSITILLQLGMEIFKIPSGEITNLPYLRRISQLGKKVILSTGMATLAEVQAALGILIQSGTGIADITILHCHTEYPTAPEDVNLLAMLTLRQTFSGVRVGYSDHTLGIAIPIAAAALGAEVIEKHFTLDRMMTGPDHSVSLVPEEFKEMVQAIRNVELALGDGVKKPSSVELQNLQVVRKTIVADRAIDVGETFTDENLAVKRAGRIGFSPMLWDTLIGKKASRAYHKDEVIEPI